MANMSYCRFENTASDLQDCVYAMEEADDIPGLDLSKYETAAYERLAALCREFLEHDARLRAASTEEVIHKLLEDFDINAEGIAGAL
jgi:antirestriction protein